MKRAEAGAGLPEAARTRARRCGHRLFFIRASIVAGCAIAIASTGRAGSDRVPDPENGPPPAVAAGDSVAESRALLGRRLFTDVRLSFNQRASCATCHDPDRDFTDGRRLSIGADGRSPARHTPSLWNVADNASFTWIDQGFTTLEAQLRVPLTGRDPVELGFDADAAARLAADPAIAGLHRDAFGAEPLGESTVIRALAAYLRTLVRRDSPFDRALLWDDAAAFGARERAGMALFFSERLRCSLCHAGRDLGGPTVTSGEVIAPVIHRTAVSGAATAFRAPSLRFVSRTAPYMHDGSLDRLEAVVDFYERGGGPGAERLVPFTLTPEERAALLAFLESL